MVTECKSIRSAGVSLLIDWPRSTSRGGEGGGGGVGIVLPLADLWENEAEESASQVPPALSGLILLLLLHLG